MTTEDELNITPEPDNHPPTSDLGLGFEKAALPLTAPITTKKPCKPFERGKVLPIPDEAADDFVQRIFGASGLTFRYDGTIVQSGAIDCANSPDQVDEFLALDSWTFNDAHDEICIIAQADEHDFRPGEIKAGLRKVRRRQRKLRFSNGIRPYLQKASAQDMLRAEQQWRRLSQLFDIDPVLTIAAFQHFIYLVKQKALGRDAEHHLMIVIFSAIQGAGKTTFERNFLAPLDDLISADAQLSDFTDPRSGEIYEYLVVLIDDIDALPEKLIATLKAILTAQKIGRRGLHTSNFNTRRQKATLLGTSNLPIHQLIKDPTGMRRFCELPFRNTNPEKGGDETLRFIVNDLDYELLWRSVDPFGPAPIKPVLAQLYAHQDKSLPVSPMLLWLQKLDIHSEKIKQITERGAVKADALRSLYSCETGEDVTNYKFAEQMARHLWDANMPFKAKEKRENGTFYIIRADTT